MRLVAEYKGRAQIWKVRYEKIVSDGTRAVASKTVASYGVTPNDIQNYKIFAEKQLQVASAQKAVEAAKKAYDEAATAAIYGNMKSIQDKTN